VFPARQAQNHYKFQDFSLIGGIMYKRKSPSSKERIAYLTRRFDKLFKEDSNFDVLKDKRIRGDFTRLTRLLFDSVLPRKCAECGTIHELQIHHRKYRYPIIEEDLTRLCKRDHHEEHQKIIRKYD